MVEWAEKHNLKRATTHCQGLHWLISSRCGATTCDSLGGSWMDHVTRWNRYGRPAILLAQPYHVNDDDRAAIAALNSDDLVTRISDNPWYGLDTVGVEIWRRDAA